MPSPTFRRTNRLGPCWTWWTTPSRGASKIESSQLAIVLDPEDALWDGFVAAAGHPLQYSGWGRLKSAFGWTARRVLVTRAGRPVLGAQVLFRRLLFGPMAYVPRGPVGTDLAAWDSLFAGLREVCTEAKASFVKIEPGDEWAPVLLASGFRVSPLTIQPRTTIALDLAETLDELGRQQNENTRRNIKSAARKGIAIRQAGPEAADLFYSLAADTAERDGFGLHSQAYHQTVFRELEPWSRVFVAEADGEPLGSIFVVQAGGEAIYLYGASSSQQRQRNPNQALQWAAICWAKETGLRVYDFWGIPDGAFDDPEALGTGGLWGVYRFKRGFGGELVQHPGAFDLPLSPRYQLWRLAFAAFSRLRPGPVGGG